MSFKLAVWTVVIFFSWFIMAVLAYRGTKDTNLITVFVASFWVTVTCLLAGLFLGALIHEAIPTIYNEFFGTKETIKTSFSI